VRPSESTAETQPKLHPALLRLSAMIVIGKAFWDIGHAPKDQSNRRKYMPGYAVWEIHPVMKLETAMPL
jgi:hypothetical protein